MFRHNLKYFSVTSVLIAAQFTAILVYLNENIVNVGEIGAALPLLAAYFGLSGIIFIFLWFQKAIFFRLHFFVFLFFIAWIALRVAIDLGELEYLKAITIATTGGILLFYLAGAFFNMAYVRLQENPEKKAVHIFIIIIYLLLTIYSFFNLLSRSRGDIFFIDDFDGDYQRSGNFISISFVAVSVIFSSLLSSWTGVNKDKIKIFFWFLIYTVIAKILLLGSQLIGSNSATAVIIGIYILTVISVMLMKNRKLKRLHTEGLIAFPFSKNLMKLLIFFVVIGIALLVTLIYIFIQVTNFDIANIRLLGFGSGSNTSLASRFDILMQTGVDQMSHAPLLGDMNVAYIITGNSGTTLHSFFLYIFANLGLVGLIVVLAFFMLIFQQLFRICKFEFRRDGSFIRALTILYFMAILMFFLLFANLAVGVTWIVIWFMVGFISQPFSFK